MIILDGQYAFDTKGETEISRLERKSSRQDSITGYLISTQSRYVRWRFNCNLLVGIEDLESLQEFFATRNGVFDFVDFRGFSWLTGAGVDNTTHAYSTGALFDMNELVPQPQNANGSQAPCQSWLVPITIVCNARNIRSGNAGNTAEVDLIHDAPSGTINGINANFVVTQNYSTYILFVNGLEAKDAVDYNRSGLNIVFVAGAIPETGDTIDGYGVV